MALYDFKDFCDDFDLNRMFKYRRDIIKDYIEEGLTIYELSAKYTLSLKYIRKAVRGKARGSTTINTLSVRQGL